MNYGTAIIVDGGFSDLKKIIESVQKDGLFERNELLIIINSYGEEKEQIESFLAPLEKLCTVVRNEQEKTTADCEQFSVTHFNRNDKSRIRLFQTYPNMLVNWVIENGKK